jgi:hypothetical protein
MHITLLLQKSESGFKVEFILTKKENRSKRVGYPDIILVIYFLPFR